MSSSGGQPKSKPGSPVTASKKKKSFATKQTNTTDDLIECKKCKEREAQLLLGDLKSDIFTDYVKAINYINTCHSIINELTKNKKKISSAVSSATSLLMPEMPNFLAIFKSFNFGDAEVIRDNSLANEQEDDSNRCGDGKNGDKNCEESFGKIYLPPKNVTLSQVTVPKELGLTDSENEFEMLQKISLQTSQKQLETRGNDEEDIITEVKCNQLPQCQSENTTVEKKKNIKRNKPKVPKVLLGPVQNLSDSNEKQNESEMGCEYFRNFHQTLSQQELDKYAKELLLTSTDNSGDSSPVSNHSDDMECPRKLSVKPLHKTQNHYTNSGSNSPSRSSSTMEGIPRRKITTDMLNTYNIQPAKHGVCRMESINQQASMNACYSIRHNFTSPNSPISPNRKNNQEDYAQEDYNYSTDERSMNLCFISRQNEKPNISHQSLCMKGKDNVAARTATLFKSCERKRAQSPIKTSMSCQSGVQKVHVTKKDSVHSNNSQKPNYNTVHNPVNYNIEKGKPHDFFTVPRNINKFCRGSKKLRPKSSGSIIVSDKEESEGITTDSDIDEDHFQGRQQDVKNIKHCLLNRKSEPTFTNKKQNFLMCSSMAALITPEFLSEDFENKINEAKTSRSNDSKNKPFRQPRQSVENIEEEDEDAILTFSDSGEPKIFATKQSSSFCNRNSKIKSEKCDRSDNVQKFLKHVETLTDDTLLLNM